MLTTAPHLVLVPGPLVGASSLAPLAEQLRLRGARVELPDVLAAAGGSLPAWPEWPDRVLGLMSPGGAPIVVGYSASTVVAAALASKRAVRGLVFLDGDIPPPSGPTPPGSDALRALVASLADDAGQLPLWSDFWRQERQRALIGLQALALDAPAYAAFHREQPRATLAWFQDTLQLARWGDVSAAYVRTSPFFDAAADEAQRRGWPTMRLDGTHLHATLQPQQTAQAILDASGRWPVRSPA